MIISNELIPISGGEMSLHISGKGSKTIIFLSGGLTSSPILDFKTLFTKLEDDFKIVVIEKFGYGFSSDSHTPRDIDTMLKETRTCLAFKNIQPPYILAPHSMSGIEALRWVDKYPEEVDALIGLDMANNAAYEKLTINLPMLKLNRWLVKLKVTKLLPKLIESDAAKYGDLSPLEIRLYSDLFYKNFITQATLNEVKTVKENALKIKEVDLSSVPLLIFSSNGKGTGINGREWVKIQQTLSDSSSLGSFFLLDCPHYIHNHKADEIANIIKAKFIKNLVESINE